MPILDIYQMIICGNLEKAERSISELVLSDKLEGKILQAQILEQKGKFEEARDLIKECLNESTESDNNLMILASHTVSLYVKNRLAQKELFDEDLEEGEAIIKKLKLFKYSYNDIQREKYNIWMGYYYNINAMIENNKGAIIRGIEYSQISIKYRKKLKNKLFIGMTLNNLGVFYLMMGEYLTAKSYLVDSLEYAINYKSNYLQAYIRLNLGMISYLTGQPKLAVQLLIESLEHILKVSPSKMFISSNYLFMILSFIDLKKYDLTDEYIDKIDKIHKETEYKIIKLHYNLAIALKAKSENRIVSQAKSLSILRSIVDAPIIDIIISRFAMINLADLLLVEYKLSGEQDVFEELQEVVSTLFQIAYDQESSSLQVEVKIFQARFAITKGEFKKVDKLLLEAENLSRINQNERLIKKISELRSLIDIEINNWKLMIEDTGEMQKEEKNKILDYLSDLGHVVK